MDLKNITVTEISGVVTVYSEKGKRDKMTSRKTCGLSFCKEGQITYIQNGREYVSNKDCAVILPKGGTYFIKRDKTAADSRETTERYSFLVSIALSRRKIKLRTRKAAMDSMI